MLAVAGCSAPKPTPAELSAGEPVSGLTLETVSETSIPEVYEASGAVRAQLNATLSSKVMGRVTSVSVREGDDVRLGQLLVSLDSRELSSGVEAANANLNASLAGVRTAETMRALESKSSVARIAQAEAQVAMAQANVNASQAKLDLALAGPRTQEKAQARLALEQAESNVRLAKTRLDRVASLASQGAIPKKELDVAQNAYELAVAQRDSAAEALRIAQEGTRTEDLRAAREAVQQAQAGLTQAQAGLAQARASALNNRVRESEVQGARAQATQMKAALGSARVSLAYASVPAPFAGRIVARLVDPGAMATPGSPLLTLEGGRLRLEASIPEKHIGRLKVGDPISVHIDATGADLQGKVDEVVPQGERASHTFLVKIALPEEGEARSGMFGRAFVPLGETKAILVPKQAAWQKEGLWYIFAVNAEGTIRLRLITTGRTLGERLQVLSGLAPGDRIVARGRENARDGAKVAGQ